MLCYIFFHIFYDFVFKYIAYHDIISHYLMRYHVNSYCMILMLFHTSLDNTIRWFMITLHLFLHIKILSKVEFLIFLRLNLFTDYLILSYLILSYLILSYLILSYLISSYLILSYLILSYLILSYLILSYLILSYLIFLFL